MPEYQEMVKSLRAAGHRLTPQRESVLAAIADSPAHLTAEEILRRVRLRYPYLNKSAVYRSLDLLTRLGFVTQTYSGQGRAEYELHRHPHHHHIVCRSCGQATQVEDGLFIPLANNLRTHYGFEAELDHLTILGRCRACRGKEQRARKPRAPRAGRAEYEPPADSV